MIKRKKKVQNILLFLVIGIPAGTLLSCANDKRETIMQKASERTLTYRLKKTAECRNTLLREASSIVDSLLLTEARLQMNDSLARARPFKPAKPVSILPIDSQIVQPFFKQ
jgi:hypothetical protein